MKPLARGLQHLSSQRPVKTQGASRNDWTGHDSRHTGIDSLWRGAVGRCNDHDSAGRHRLSVANLWYWRNADDPIGRSHFNGTSTAPATLIVDRNTTLDSDSWLFNATGNAVNQITLSGSRRAVIKLLDGIDMTISKSVGGAVYNSGTASGIVYELGNGSQLRFVDNHANNGYRSLIISNSDVVFGGERDGRL